jgi:hypothetical protein
MDGWRSHEREPQRIVCAPPQQQSHTATSRQRPSRSCPSNCPTLSEKVAHNRGQVSTAPGGTISGGSRLDPIRSRKELAASKLRRIISIHSLARKRRQAAWTGCSSLIPRHLVRSLACPTLAKPTLVLLAAVCPHNEQKAIFPYPLASYATLGRC